MDGVDGEGDGCQPFLLAQCTFLHRGHPLKKSLVYKTERQKVPHASFCFFLSCLAFGTLVFICGPRASAPAVHVARVEEEKKIQEGAYAQRTHTGGFFWTGERVKRGKSKRTQRDRLNCVGVGSLVALFVCSATTLLLFLFHFSFFVIFVIFTCLLPRSTSTPPSLLTRAGVMGQSRSLTAIVRRR